MGGMFSSPKAPPPPPPPAPPAPPKDTREAVIRGQKDPTSTESGFDKLKIKPKDTSKDVQTTKTSGLVGVKIKKKK